MFNFKDRVAFISGGASGIGLALAKSLTKAGMRVAIADIDTQQLDCVAAEFDLNELLCVPLDVSDRSSWANARELVLARFGAVDLLCNNAGIGPDGCELAEMVPRSFDSMIATNLTGVFNGIHTFAADMRARRSGHILNTSSTAGLMVNAQMGAYTAAKFAVVGMSEVLRAEIAPHNVGVTVFCPGLIRTRLEQTTIALGNESITGVSMDMAMEPSEAVQCAISAVRENRLYALSHPEYWPNVQQRIEALTAAFEMAEKKG